METPAKRSRAMRAIIARHIGEAVIGNVPFMLAVAVLIAIVIAFMWPPGGERRVFKAIVTGYGLGSKYNSAATVFVRMPDGNKGVLRLHNSAGCRIGSTITVTRNKTLLGLHDEPDPTGCH